MKNYRCKTLPEKKVALKLRYELKTSLLGEDDLTISLSHTHVNCCGVSLYRKQCKKTYEKIHKRYELYALFNQHLFSIHFVSGSVLGIWDYKGDMGMVFLLEELVICWGRQSCEQVNNSTTWKVL